MKRISRVWRRRLIELVVILSILGVWGGAVAWYKFFREMPQPEFANEEMRFKYGSLGSEQERGIPYFVWLVLPRIFPEYMPGPGGYKSFGFVWEEGEELPVGFAKKTVGFPRVTNNCALCHTASFRTREDETPRIVAAGPSHTTNLQGYIRFLSAAAKDPRFNADVILDEISRTYELSWLDKKLYRYLIIPLTRKALLEQEGQFAWMNRPGWPDWGPGRDDPMNLTKYFMTQLPVDHSVGNADFPSIWNLQIREGKSLNWDGATPSPRSVVIDSALGLGAPPTPASVQRMEELTAWLKALPPPKFPFTGEHGVNAELAAAGRKIYVQHCASCHEADGKQTGTVIDISEIGTDRERLDTWTQAAADEANRRVKEMGVTRIEMVKTNGYVSPPLDGVWLRAPYLHNGSVPHLRDLLEPPEKRTKVFYRGYDVLDPDNVGFVSQGKEAERAGYRFDTQQRGNGNAGHIYGVELSPEEKRALLEYLKTL
jgi:hypothetical protein